MSIQPRAGLPLPADPAFATRKRQVGPSTIAVSIINDRARLSGRRIFAELRWPAGQPITYTVAGHLIAIRSAHPHETRHRISRLGQIRLPAATRRATGIVLGDPLLLIAIPNADVVAIVPAPIVYEALSSALALLHGAA
ncbi:AbrB/MazE/SpoVT family DNA-binding domain-containing protein [Nocardia araoensis]|uniref:AbrB/MazE/SpoVT family DNA-binding domain-containing protein n=1 Tax=Nocardia araoensis TaxID=228600 RepID=UPI0012F64357|nr:AbrB/MazE/SpoVT family DNA-binding domain-containing protein [Nocardia araoensis]